ncbi:MAG: hypothetical protein V3T98_01715 [Candidatus Paceibacterota bacterium]
MEIIKNIARFKGGNFMVDSGLGVGEAEVLKVKNKANKRKHGQRFGSEKEALNVMYPGEIAVVIVDKDKSAIEFYGEPTKDEIENFLIGAKELYTDKKVKIKTIRKENKKRMIPY